jgi:hypothetical protein
MPIELREDELNRAVEAHGGNPWAALRALLQINEELERALEERDVLLSRGLAAQPSAGLVH